MNNAREAWQHVGFYFLYLEPIQHIKIIGDFFPRDCILVYDKLITNPLQNNFFSQKIVHEIRVGMEV